MITRSNTPQLLLASSLILGATTLAITITPISHDYSQVPVSALASQSFRVTLPAATQAGTTLTFTIAGADPNDFVSAQAGKTVDPFTGCSAGAQAITCTDSVGFRPKSLGPKQATLVVTDNHGNRATAALKGIGVAPLCTHTVVPCNYAHYFSGTFGWRSVSSGPGGSDTETVDVNVVNGIALCSGGSTSSAQGRTRTGSINGPGLIGVEFLPDPVHTWVYRITVACPSVAWPATADEPATASEPAELGRGEQSSDKQPTGGVGLTLEQAIARLARLQKSITFPGNDPANGVTGSLTISWNLVRS